MVEMDLGTIKRRSVKGAVVLTSQTIFLQLVNFVGMFLLTIFLSPDVFGIFFVVSAVISFLSHFSDVGLAAALIQKKEKPTQADLQTTFTIQQALVLILLAMTWLVSPWLARFYNLSPAGLGLLRALIVAFFLSSLKTIPSVLLERKLDFQRLIIPQIGEAILFNLVAVFLAWQGRGVASFSWAVLGRGVIGLALIYFLQPWRPGLAYVRASAKKLLSFGVPFQANSLLALVKDDLLTIFLGKFLPFAQVGFVGWAQKWANLPLRFVMDSVNKVTFPTYSRIQDNLKALRVGIEKALFAVCFLTFPSLAGLSVLAAPLVEFLPRYQKWQPALISLCLFCAQAALACISTTLVNILNATGRIKTTLKLMVFWTSLTWFATPVLVFRIGFNGVALAALLVGLTVFWPIVLVKKITDFSLWENVGKPLLAALFMATALYWLVPVLVVNLASLVSAIGLGGIIYLSLMWAISREKIVEAANLVAASVKKR